MLLWATSNSPEIILLDTRNSINCSNFCPCTDELHPNVCSNFNYLILVVCILWWSGIRIKFDFVRDELKHNLSTRSSGEENTMICGGKTNMV